jgi:LuxR family transcriptional regulator of spore coat protein
VYVEQMSKGPAVAVPPAVREQLEAFYAAEYKKQVKILVLLDARPEEAEDAVQKAMTDFAKRAQAGQAPGHPSRYVQRAAFRFFVKARQRDRERPGREIRGGHLVLEEHRDDQLTAMEDEQYIEYLLEFLTPTQQQVIKLVMDGLSTHEIAEELGKTDETIRQHLKNGRDRLKVHPEIAPVVPRYEQSPVRQRARSTVTTPEPRKEEVQ